MSSFNLADLWEGVVAELADERPALVVGGADRPTVRQTHRELDERANRLAHHLRSWGVEPGDRVAIDLYNCGEFVETTLALFKLRAVPVNLNYRYVAEEIRYVLDDADARGVVAEADLAPRVAEARPDLPLLRRGAEYESAIAAAPAVAPPDVGPRSGDDLWILYTGGTTGMPKGVMWRHEDLFFGVLGGEGVPRQGIPRLDDPGAIGPWARQGTGVTRRFPLCPLMHGLGAWTTLTALLTGGTAVLSTDRSFDAAAALRLAADEQVELLSIIGDAIARPLAVELRRAPDLYDLSSLRMITSSGAILSAAVRDDLLELVPHVKVVNRFGASETGPQGQMRSMPGSGEAPRLAGGPDVAVLDDDNRPLPPGTGRLGRLARRGHIPLGYWNDPVKTAATFPVIDGVRWSVPGDLAEVAEDGSILVHGRGSMVINSGGEKIFPEEVEAAVKAHPAIFDAIAVGVPDERFGQRVGVVVQLRPGATAPGIEELKAHCSGTIAAYKCPRELVVAEQVRRTAVDKADYAWAKAYMADRLAAGD
ncbi:MAG: AMP-binding protein [Acidimicrobiales bacterium]|jgi:fatty-acyl-CoA synthase|nr:AMP-binding protein [Acidimicrobiales bacterium]